MPSLRDPPFHREPTMSPQAPRCLSEPLGAHAAGSVTREVGSRPILITAPRHRGTAAAAVRPGFGRGILGAPSRPGRRWVGGWRRLRRLRPDWGFSLLLSPLPLPFRTLPPPAPLTPLPPLLIPPFPPLLPRLFSSLPSLSPLSPSPSTPPPPLLLLPPPSLPSLLFSSPFLPLLPPLLPPPIPLPFSFPSFSPPLRQWHRPEKYLCPPEMAPKCMNETAPPRLPPECPPITGSRGGGAVTSPTIRKTRHRAPRSGFPGSRRARYPTADLVSRDDGACASPPEAKPGAERAAHPRAEEASAATPGQTRGRNRSPRALVTSPASEHHYPGLRRAGGASPARPLRPRRFSLWGNQKQTLDDPRHPVPFTHLLTFQAHMYLIRRLVLLCVPAFFSALRPLPPIRGAGGEVLAVGMALVHRSTLSACCLLGYDTQGARTAHRPPPTACLARFWSIAALVWHVTNAENNGEPRPCILLRPTIAGPMVPRPPSGDVGIALLIFKSSGAATTSGNMEQLVVALGAFARRVSRGVMRGHRVVSTPKAQVHRSLLIFGTGFRGGSGSRSWRLRKGHDKSGHSNRNPRHESGRLMATAAQTPRALRKPKEAGAGEPSWAV
ncbi:hypothetical protein C7M84_003578 [Penaeus vannamei]|uniref:Uncharacterized protein n=1 Tax=Penaeus vannamei TaxID=6689 RepID=A0A3R7PUW1_PENVA|nr:hypothetical protein C7M84_003578 [Penaeus vannamei]